MTCNNEGYAVLNASRNVHADLAVAIVGMGPRGLSVLERLLIDLTEHPTTQRVLIWAIDPDEPGAGRIWRTTQPEWFMMNTAAGEVSVYSSGPDGGPARAGAGPSLAEWLTHHPDPRWSALGPNDYAPRPVYGQYMHEAFNNFVANAPDNVIVVPVPARVKRIERRDGKQIVITDHDGLSVEVDKVVLSTGHPRNRPNAKERRFVEFAEHNPGLRYLASDSAADLRLDSIPPGEPVGIIGLGLSFFDVLMTLTVGRGGRFEARADGSLRYHRSGREPRVVAGSRSGLVMLARGRNQKAPSYRYEARFASAVAIAAARRRAQRHGGSAQLDFLRDVLPLLRLEVENVYYVTAVRRRQGAAAAERFASLHQRLVRIGQGDQVEQLCAEFGIADLPPLDLERMARPFENEKFSGPEEFHDRLLALLRDDLAEAAQGNLDGPLKAALDVLRDIRGSVRQAVEFAGLLPASHNEDFLGWYNPINTMVSAGPPAVRVAQACALIDEGILTVVGPHLEIECDTTTSQFALSSPSVCDSRRLVNVLIDARIPRPSVRLDSSDLFTQLLDDGRISEHINTDPISGTKFESGGVAVVRGTLRAIDADGHADPNLFAVGIPTENTRWFTQIGNGRPGPLTGFHVDADAIAKQILAPLTAKPTVIQASPARKPLTRVSG
jgi:hypothetical protein